MERRLYASMEAASSGKWRTKGMKSDTTKGMETDAAKEVHRVDNGRQPTEESPESEVNTPTSRWRVKGTRLPQPAPKESPLHPSTITRHSLQQKRHPAHHDGEKPILASLELNQGTELRTKEEHALYSRTSPYAIFYSARAEKLKKSVPEYSGDKGSAESFVDEQPVAIEVEEDEVPEHLKQFICANHYQPMIQIKRTDPSELDDKATDELVESTISRMLKTTKYGANREGTTANNSHRNPEMPTDTLLFPNPLIRKFRGSVSDIDNKRSKQLWASSYSHGVSWDHLDMLYLKFIETREESIKKWDEKKEDIAEFASKIAKRKIHEWKPNIANSPPRLLRKWTHRLYNVWYERYMGAYSPCMLSRYLKGEVTDCVLAREINEYAETKSTELPFKTQTSRSNPHFVTRGIHRC